MSNEPSYLIILLERQYIAQLVNALSQQKQILKQVLSKNKYDVEASAKLPKVNHDLKAVTEILLAYNNIINCRLQDVYKFEFQSIKTVPIPKEQPTKSMHYKPEQQPNVIE